MVTEGRNVIIGNSAANTLYGNGGGDTLYGFANNDVLVGGDGADILDSGTGNDNLSGNADADLFKFAAGDGLDVINYFSAAQGDRLAISIDAGRRFRRVPGGRHDGLRQRRLHLRWRHPDHHADRHQPTLASSRRTWCYSRQLWAVTPHVACDRQTASHGTWAPMGSGGGRYCW